MRRGSNAYCIYTTGKQALAVHERKVLADLVPVISEA